MNKSNTHLGHQAKKRFGQNFLHNDAVISRIVDAINPETGENLIEIGPGLGALTEPVVERAGDISVVELDRDLAHRLRHHPFLAKHLTIHEIDALKFDFASLATEDKPMRIFGNLPYNISTPLIFHLFEHADIISEMHFMLQKEVVDRMTASPGNKQYGRLTVMTQYFCQAVALFDVPPHAFQPAPKVMSSIVRLIPYKTKPIKTKDVAHLSHVVTTAFNFRRKTVRNALKAFANEDQLIELGIKPDLRPESLSLAQFVAVADASYKPD